MPASYIYICKIHSVIERMDIGIFHMSNDFMWI